MEIAIQKAKECKDEVPVAAVIVKDGTVISVAHNQMIKNCDPTAHAEVLAIREAAQKLNNYRLNDCDLYVTLEPCQMCEFAIKLARIKNVFVGASNIFDKDNHRLQYYEGIMEEECSKILKDFFSQKR